MRIWIAIKDASRCAWSSAQAWVVPSCAVVNCYVPNSGEGLKRLDYRLKDWDVAFAAYLGALGQKKPVILTGDLNCAHQEIDIHAPKRNLKSAGFTPVRALLPATSTPHALFFFCTCWIKHRKLFGMHRHMSALLYMWR